MSLSEYQEHFQRSGGLQDVLKMGYEHRSFFLLFWSEAAFVISAVFVGR